MFRLSDLRVALVVCLVTLSPAHHGNAQERTQIKSWQINQTISEMSRPLLCRDHASIELVVSVISLGIKARDEGDMDKAKRLFKLASGLQSEICLKPKEDDILIVRCRIKEHDFVAGKMSIAKVSAVLRDEASRGEQPFFAWTYNFILDSAESDDITKSAYKRWCTDAKQDVAAKTRKLDLTPRLILGVQYRLYDLGYAITKANGQQTGELVNILSAFQKNAGLPQTGRIDQVTLDRLAQIRPPKHWLALTFDGSGNYGLITDGTSRRAAEERAIAAYKRKSNADYRLMSQPAPGCYAVAMTRFRGRKNGRRMKFTNTFGSFGDDKRQARQAVIDYCNKAKSGGKCRVKTVACATGPAIAQPRERRPGQGGQIVPADSGSTPKPKRFDPEDLIQSQAKRYDPNANVQGSGKPTRIDPGTLVQGAENP